MFNVVWQSGWEGVCGRMDPGTGMIESLCCSPETATTLFVNRLYPNTSKNFNKNKYIKKEKKKKKRKHCQTQCHVAFALFCSSFIDFARMFTYLISFELIFVYGIK